MNGWDQQACEEMVKRYLVRGGIRDSRVLDAMRTVPRHRFVPSKQVECAYENRPLPIGREQTISQPYIVALMTEALGLEGHEKVLEIGTGSGYQTAILSEIAGEVYTVEIIEKLARRAGTILDELGYGNVHARVGDGYQGWPEEAPFHAILVTAAPERIPSCLEQQLAVGGRLVLPVGTSRQELLLITRTSDGYHRRRLALVAFVPMTRGG